MGAPAGGAAGERRTWEIVGRDRVADCEVFRVDRLRARSPRNGRTYDRYVLDVPDWVNVVAFTEDGHVILVEQYRFGAGILSLEFPAGILEPGESPADGARRELHEETGYEPADIQVIGEVFADPALQDNRLHVVAARGCRRVASPHQDESEDVRIRLVTPEELRGLLRDGGIRHALALTTWFLFQERAGPRGG